MEEIFKGLVERAQYYEQFESFRNTSLCGQFGDVQIMDLKMKAPTMSM
jgi:hypothetical protein